MVVRDDPPPSVPALASLVLGILAVLSSPLLLGGALGIAGIVLGLVHLRRRGAPRRMAAWGAGLSAGGVLLSIALGGVYYRLYGEFLGTLQRGGGEESELDPWQGKSVPELTLTTIHGERVRLAELAGRRVVLDFWATWCAPCREEIPHLKRLAAENPLELVVIGISDESTATIRDFAEREDIAYHLVSAEAFPVPFDGIHSVPTTVFIDRRGVIQNVLVGYHDFDTLKARALEADYAGAPRAASSEAAPSEPRRVGERQRAGRRPVR